MLRTTQKVLARALNQFKKGCHQGHAKDAGEKSLSLDRNSDAKKITEAISSVDIFSVNSPMIRCGFPILTLNEFNENQNPPIVIDCRNETVSATKKYLAVRKLEKINPKKIIDAKNEIISALNQPAKVVIKERSGKTGPRFVIILYPTSQQPEALLFTTSNRRGPKSSGFEMEKKNLLWSWRLDKEPETSGVFLLKLT
jgi:hypothetical protein